MAMAQNQNVRRISVRLYRSNLIQTFDMLLPMPNSLSLASKAAAVAVVLFAGCSLAIGQASSSNDLDFLHGLDEYENIRRMLPEYMERNGEALVESRKR